MRAGSVWVSPSDVIMVSAATASAVAIACENEGKIKDTYQIDLNIKIHLQKLFFIWNKLMPSISIDRKLGKQCTAFSETFYQILVVSI